MTADSAPLRLVAVDGVALGPAGIRAPARLFYMDAARALLMFLGIPYHTAMAYSSLTHWTIKSLDPSLAFSWFAALTHAFRMPPFFIIAGFFSGMILQKKGALNWLSYRTPRLLVPLATVCIALNPFVMLAASMGRAPDGQVASDWTRQLTSIGAHWMAQMWFLVDLLFYSLVLVLAARWGTRLGLAPLKHWVARSDLTRPWINLAVLIALGLFATVAAIGVKLAGLSQFADGLIFPSRTFADMPFFFAGVALALSPRLLSDFTRFRWWMALLAGLGCVLYAAIEYREDAASTLLCFFITPAVGIVAAQVVFAGVKRWLDRPNALISLGVDASMVVYLTHIIFVVWLVYLFRWLSLPPELEVVLIVAITTGLALGVNWTANRSRFLYFLLHGAQSKRIAAHTSAASIT